MGAVSEGNISLLRNWGWREGIHTSHVIQKKRGHEQSRMWWGYIKKRVKHYRRLNDQILRRFRIRHMFHLQKTLGLDQPANHEVSKFFIVRHTQEAKILKRNVRLNRNHH
jgi:hypothetical protein